MSEKVIVRLDDLVKWTVPDAAGWVRGQHAQPLKAAALRELGRNGQREALHRYRESTLTSGLSFRDIQRERAQLGERPGHPGVGVGGRVGDQGGHLLLGWLVLLDQKNGTIKNIKSCRRYWVKMG